jgi:hypothetical protein
MKNIGFQSIIGLDGRFIGNPRNFDDKKIKTPWFSPTYFPLLSGKHTKSY